MIPFLEISEPFSSISHLAGAVVFFVLSFILYRRGIEKGSPVWGPNIFSFTSVLLLSLSGVYHFLPKGGAASLVIRRLDHAAIFLLIAGSFTAVHGTLFKGFWRWGMISLIWVTAFAGIAAKALLFNSISEGLSLSFYIGLGWFGAVSGFLLWRRFGLIFILPLLLGAASYTIGALLEFFVQTSFLPGVIGPHEIFHLFVLGGLTSHWWFIYQAMDQGKPLHSGSPYLCP